MLLVWATRRRLFICSGVSCRLLSITRHRYTQCWDSGRYSEESSRILRFSPTCRSFPRSLVCPYVLLLVVSRLFCPCSCLHVTLLSLPVPLLPCAAGLIARRSSSSCGPQTLPAGAGNALLLAEFTYCLCYFTFFWRE